jgi:hypothetical protein
MRLFVRITLSDRKKETNLHDSFGDFPFGFRTLGGYTMIVISLTFFAPGSRFPPHRSRTEYADERAFVVKGFAVMGNSGSLTS